MIIKSFDTNGWYSMEVQKNQWLNSDSDELSDTITFELNNTDWCPEKKQIPEETTFVMKLSDAKYLKSYLDVALNGL